MRCPECQKEMTRVGNFVICGNHAQPISLPITERPAHPFMELLERLPTPLALPISEYLGEESPFIALHRLTDAAELITRFFAIVALSDVHQRLDDFPDAFKRELADKLARPTFGAWRDIAASALRTLQNQRQLADTEVCPYVTELPEFWHERYQPLIGKGDIEYHQTDILALRNFLAHQGRLSDEVATSLFEVHRPRFEEALQQLGFLADYRLIATLKEGESPLLLRGLPHQDDWSLPRLVEQTVSLPHDTQSDSLRYEPQRVYLIKENEALDLFPLHSYDVVMLWCEEEQDFREVDKPAPMLYLRYNERRGMLEFTALAKKTPFAQRGEYFLEAFLSAFNLSEWRRQMEEAEVRRSEWKRGGYDFRDLVLRRANVLPRSLWIRCHRFSGGEGGENCE